MILFSFKYCSSDNMYYPVLVQVLLIWNDSYLFSNPNPNLTQPKPNPNSTLQYARIFGRTHISKKKKFKKKKFYFFFLVNFIDFKDFMGGKMKNGHVRTKKTI